MARIDLLNQKLEDAFDWFEEHEPFLSYIVRNVDIVYMAELQTAATDGLNIYIDPAFMVTLTVQDLVFILMHETLHIILLHHQRNGNRQKLPYNIACDIVVNDTIAQYGYEKMILSTAIRGQQFDTDGTTKTVEAIYDALPVINPDRVLLIDEHMFFPELDSNEVKRAVNDMIFRAYQRGCLNGDKPIERHFIKTIKSLTVNKNLLPVIQKYLQVDERDYTYHRTDKRYQDVLFPEFNAVDQIFKNVWFVIDASFSMKHRDMQDIYENIVHLIKGHDRFECVVSFFSTIVTTPVTFSSVRDFEEVFRSHLSTGGTDFGVIFASLNPFFLTDIPLLIIIMTDGRASYPPSSAAQGIPVIWVMTREAEPPSFGEIVRI